MVVHSFVESLLAAEPANTVWSVDFYGAALELEAKT